MKLFGRLCEQMIQVFEQTHVDRRKYPTNRRKNNATYGVKCRCQGNYAHSTARELPINICVRRRQTVYTVDAFKSTSGTLCWEKRGWSLIPRETFHQPPRRRRGRFSWTRPTTPNRIRRNFLTTVSYLTSGLLKSAFHSARCPYQNLVLIRRAPL